VFGRFFELPDSGVMVAAGRPVGRGCRCGRGGAGRGRGAATPPGRGPSPPPAPGEPLLSPPRSGRGGVGRRWSRLQVGPASVPWPRGPVRRRTSRGSVLSRGRTQLEVSERANARQLPAYDHWGRRESDELAVRPRRFRNASIVRIRGSNHPAGATCDCCGQLPVRSTVTGDGGGSCAGSGCGADGQVN
jgi:hypothetical protein